MLIKRAKFRIDRRSGTEETVLGDFFIEEDMSSMSGTVSENDTVYEGQRVTISSGRVDGANVSATVTDVNVVARNGYIKYPYNAPLEYMYHVSDEGVKTKVFYFTLDGNTYYEKIETQSGNHVFNYNGTEVDTDGDEYVTVMRKAYIEDNKVIVGDKSFNVSFGGDGSVHFTDENGSAYVPEGWNFTGVKGNPEYVKKVTIQRNSRQQIPVSSSFMYGYVPYIDYGGEKLYIGMLYDDEGNETFVGVEIDGVQYMCTSFMEGSDGLDTSSGFTDIYNIESYYRNPSTGNVTMDIEGNQYVVNFEPSTVGSYGKACIVLSDAGVNVYEGCIISVKTEGDSSLAIVLKDDDKYIWVDNSRYDVISNLCDKVKIGDNYFPLIYDGDPEEPYIGMICHCFASGGDEIHFRVNSLSPDNKHVTELVKLRYVNGTWKDSYTVKNGQFVVASGYTVDNYDGVSYKGKNYEVKQFYEENYDILPEDEHATSALTVDSYEYVEINDSVMYDMMIVGIQGGNRIICEPFIKDGQLSDEDRTYIRDEVFRAVTSNAITVTSGSDANGSVTLKPDAWIGDSFDRGGYNDIYSLGEIASLGRFWKAVGTLNLNIPLVKGGAGVIGQDDKIMNYHYADVEEGRVNSPVDMEKDMYTPVLTDSDGIVQSEVSEIEINLHLRTRNMDDWSRIEDEGYSGDIEAPVNYSRGIIYINSSDFEALRFDPDKPLYLHNNTTKCIYTAIVTGHNPISPDIFSLTVDTNMPTPSEDDVLTIINRGTPNTADYRYSNWFVTDYWPYNQYINPDASVYGDDKFLGDVISRSDLLGYFYFTTDEVKMKARKVTGSFLRLSYYDSTNPQSQNILGTSTVYFNIDPLLDVQGNRHYGIHYKETLQTLKADFGEGSENSFKAIPFGTTATVLTDAFDTFSGDEEMPYINETYLRMNGIEGITYNSRLTLKPFNVPGGSSEGFYAYILKAFGEKRDDMVTKRVYMKAEFFHAGLGVRIPMVLATMPDGRAVVNWNKLSLNDLKCGIVPEFINERLYIPIDIRYDTGLRKFVYFISNENNFQTATDAGNGKLRLNLFELKPATW